MEQSTVKIYRIQCTEGFMAGEVGAGFSLTPWGADTHYYKGGDDGGTEYELPNGYTVSARRDGTLGIYALGAQYCTDIVSHNGQPCLVGPRGEIVGLALVNAAGVKQ